MWNCLQLMMAAGTAEEGRTLLGALELGVDGVVLCTEDLAEVRYFSCCSHYLFVLA